MNERIGKLAVKAGAHWEHGDWNMPSAVYFSEKDLERFAELLIQECAALAKSKSERIQSMETDDRGDQAQIHSLAWQFEEFGYEIKKHFGVEE